MTTLTKDQAQGATKLLESVAIDLRTVLLDARHELDEFEKYVDSWDEAVRLVKAGERDPREFSENYVIIRALEQIEEVANMHSGSTRASHWRTCRQRLVQLAYIGRGAR